MTKTSAYSMSIRYMDKNAIVEKEKMTSHHLGDSSYMLRPEGVVIYNPDKLSFPDALRILLDHEIKANSRLATMARGRMDLLLELARDYILEIEKAVE